MSGGGEAGSAGEQDSACPDSVGEPVREYQTEDGRTYYHDLRTNKTSWQPPQGYIPLALREFAKVLEMGMDMLGQCVVGARLTPGGRRRRQQQRSGPLPRPPPLLRALPRHNRTKHCS